MADENNQATPFTRPNAFSMYPDKSNPNSQPMNQPPQYPPNTQYPQPQQPYPQPQYPAAPGTAQYPQNQYPPAPGMAPYPQPQYFAQPPQQQQQQSSNVVVIGGQPAPVIYQQRAYTDFTGAIVFSCIVIWCCAGWVCGLIAFILAMVGQCSSSSGDETNARQLLRSSYGLSIAGVVTGIIIIIILAVTLSKVPSNYYSKGASNYYTNTPYSPTSCTYGYRYEYSVKTCCPYYDASLNCGIKGYYYSGGIKYCCPYL